VHGTLHHLRAAGSEGDNAHDEGGRQDRELLELQCENPRSDSKAPVTRSKSFSSPACLGSDDPGSPIRFDDGIVRQARVALASRGVTLRQELPLPFEGAARVRELCPRSSERGPRRLQGVHLVLRIEPREHLPGLHAVAHIDRSFDDPAGDPKSERRLVLSLDAPDQHDRFAGFRSRGDHGPHRAYLGRLGFVGRLTGCKHKRCSRETQNP